MRDFSISDIRKINEAYLTMLSESARIGSDGYDSLGFDSDGYDRFGKNVLGINKDGYDDEGYDALGFDKDGWSRDGWPSPRLNPEAYGLEPSQVEDWIKTEIEKRIAKGRNGLAQRKHLGRHSEGSYANVGSRRRRPSNAQGQEEFQNKLKSALRSFEAESKREDDEKKEEERQEFLNSEEGQAEIRAKKERMSQMRRTPEFRKRHAEYQRDYQRAMRLLYGENSGRATPDDIIWMSSNPVFKRLKAKKEKKEMEERDRIRREEEERTRIRQQGRYYRMVDFVK